MVPWYCRKIDSRVSFAGMSMLLVGSSRMRKFGRSCRIFARQRRIFSPPERSETFFPTSCPKKRKPARVWRTSFPVRAGKALWNQSNTVRSEVILAES